MKVNFKSHSQPLADGCLLTQLADVPQNDVILVPPCSCRHFSTRYIRPHTWVPVSLCNNRTKLFTLSSWPFSLDSFSSLHSFASPQDHQMDRNFQFSASSSSTAKVERRIVEKNRRNQMKNLCSQLNSLLPNQDSKEIAPTLPDQIKEAIKYIKELEIKVKTAKEKKERLMGKNSPSSEASSSSSASPQLNICEMGRSLEIVLSSGLNNHFLFCETIRILQQEGAEVVNASFSVAGNSVLHTVHAQLGDSVVEFGAAKVRERLRRLVYGSTSDMELQEQWWDFDFPPERWDL